TDVGACGGTPAIKDQSSQGYRSSSSTVERTKFWPEACHNYLKDCHPELVSGSRFFEKPWYVVAGMGFVRTRETG
ncbi:MAG: hypothetical protein WC194_02025, partial [Mesotoga sp.]|uniref:hypothetical protein n=1 Tax=Mesotoga sp. TaxID=2053577 RepID=UPI00356AFA8E